MAMAFSIIIRNGLDLNKNMKSRIWHVALFLGIWAVTISP